MLLRREGDSVSFVGTAFVAHPDGYLLTAAHILPERGELMLSPRDLGGGFGPPESDTVSSIPVRVARVDADRDVALLAFRPGTDITMPDHVIGVPEEVLPGTALACLGFPFGFHHVYTQCVYQAVLAAKVLAPSGTRLLLFDAMSEEGLRGGPLVNTTDGRVIGIVGGRFHPAQLTREGRDPGHPTGVAYAISVDHAAELLRAEGLEVI